MHAQKKSNIYSRTKKSTCIQKKLHKTTMVHTKTNTDIHNDTNEYTQKPQLFTQTSEKKLSINPRTHNHTQILFQVLSDIFKKIGNPHVL